MLDPSEILGIGLVLRWTGRRNGDLRNGLFFLLDALSEISSPSRLEEDGSDGDEDVAVKSRSFPRLDTIAKGEKHECPSHIVQVDLHNEPTDEIVDSFSRVGIRVFWQRIWGRGRSGGQEVGSDKMPEFSTKRGEQASRNESDYNQHDLACFGSR